MVTRSASLLLQHKTKQTRKKTHMIAVKKLVAFIELLLDKTTNTDNNFSAEDFDYKPVN